MKELTFQEQRFLNRFLLFIPLWYSNYSLVPDDRLHLLRIYDAIFSFTGGTDRCARVLKLFPSVHYRISALSRNWKRQPRV